MIGINFYMTLGGLHYSEIWSNIGRVTSGRNFDVTNERAACEACSAKWNLGTKSAFALGSRKTTENLDQVRRPQDLPDANCFPFTTYWVFYTTRTAQKTPRPQFVYSCVYSFPRNVFTETLPSTVRIFWLHNSDFQTLGGHTDSKAVS
jgi:hypothetical protein